ncbi:MAG: M48 family metalloprotease, partial [Gammaproteobacteria bacterium]|nr:M48 family metalloprotease [Gammaproteobacteria bacterium]
MNAITSGEPWIEAYYPRAPGAIPANLARPTRTYKVRAWLALAGLAAFFGIYLAGIAWFAWVAYRALFKAALGEGGGFWAVTVGLAACLLSAFMLKALFSLRNQKSLPGTEVRESEQPHLFAFLRRLAPEVGAPLPYKVCLSSRVNAAVVSDTSLVRLLLPQRRNLEIGLGLVNVLTLQELNAVLAHEFGHFAQRSMLVGRWVYVSAQIATALVAKRDALDAFLARATRTVWLNPLGLLMLAIAWALRLTVWSIRSITDAIFRLLVISQRALSRQMEFQADLVAVSVAGSDPLVQALHKLQAADVAWKNAWMFASSELRRGRRVPDVFALQSTAIAQLRAVLGMPDFGCVPSVPERERATYRLFKAGFAQPPQMWLTHPPSFEREENCKRQYVPSDPSDTSAWMLFENADDLRARFTAAELKSDKAVPISREESLRAYERTFERPSLDRVYRGAYLGRPVARYVDELAELYESIPAETSLDDALASLYPVSLGLDVERLRALTEERDGLKALQDASLSATDGVIRFRGEAIGRRALTATVSKVQSELDAVAERIHDHDRRCRSTHRAAAAKLGAGWEDYLGGLLALLHYAEHSEANIIDARGYLNYVMSAVTRQGRISGNGVSIVITAAETLFTAIREAFEQCNQVVLDPLVAARMGVPLWPLRNMRFTLA